MAGRTWLVSELGVTDQVAARLSITEAIEHLERSRSGHEETTPSAGSTIQASGGGVESTDAITSKGHADGRRVIATVRANPNYFSAAGESLDREYSTRAIRDRQAAELRQHRARPDHVKLSRAYQRKVFDYDEAERRLGFRPTPQEAVDSPPQRQRGLDGELQRPGIPLIERFSMAFDDTFRDETSLEVLEAKRRQEVANRRVLLGWLRLDPDRGSLRRITQFQDLRAEPTADGRPLIVPPDDVDPDNYHAVTLFVHRNGSLDHDAPNWLAKTREALDALTRLGVFEPEANPVDDGEKDQTVRRPRMKRQVAEPLIAQHLARRPHDKAAEVAQTVGCSTGVVAESKAWKLNQTRLRMAKKQGVDPVAIRLDEKTISEAGRDPTTQGHDHDIRQEVTDDLIDQQTREIDAKVGGYRQKYPDASVEEISRELEIDVMIVVKAMNREDYQFKKV